MPYPTDLIDELSLLLLFSPDTTLEGIKVHRSAAPEKIDAAQRLHTKGLTTQADGGYLTDRGRLAYEHARAALALLGEIPA
jgi:uncharacterized protein (TIGR02647 family)